MFCLLAIRQRIIDARKEARQTVCVVEGGKEAIETNLGVVLVEVNN